MHLALPVVFATGLRGRFAASPGVRLTASRWTNPSLRVEQSNTRFPRGLGGCSIGPLAGKKSK